MWEILSPDEVFASGQDGVVHVTWTDPPAGGEPGIGDECVSYDYFYNETLGLVDCIGQCVPQTTIDSWLGDGLCDDGTWGVYLNCNEYNWDGGDCPENGVASIGGEFNYRTENQLEFLLPFISDIDNNRDLAAFNIYRDGVFIATVESGIYEYYDAKISILKIKPHFILLSSPPASLSITKISPHVIVGVSLSNDGVTHVTKNLFK